MKIKLVLACRRGVIVLSFWANGAGVERETRTPVALVSHSLLAKRLPSLA